MIMNDNIPIPDVKRGGSVKGTWCKYPFREMSEGQSFFLAGDKALSRLCNSLIYHKLSDQFTVRTVIENGVSGARCFRYDIRVR